jgi:phage terminase small subunit
MPRHKTLAPGEAPATVQQAVASGVKDGEPPDAEDVATDNVQVILSPADRKRLLGRLAEFEVMLLALPPLQQNFVMAYVSDPTDGAAAARKAGYSERRAAATCCDLLARPAVAAAIALGEQLREDRTMITSDRTLHEIAIIAFSDITNFEFRRGEITTKSGVPTYATRAISSVEFTETEFIDDKGNPRTTYKTKIRLWSKDTALRMLSVYQKLLSEPSITNNVTVNDNRGQTHTHTHMHQTWKVGDRELTF